MIATKRKFVVPPLAKFSARSIRALRIREGVSPARFAAELEIPMQLLDQWERGEKVPKGPVLRLLTIVKTKGFEAILL